MTGIVPDELIQNLLPFFSTSMPFIASYNLAASAASVTFSNIPATFTHLQLWTLLRTDLAAEVDTSLIRFNGDAGNNYQRRYTYFRTLYGSTANRAASAIIGPYAEGNTATASRFTPGMTLIPFYRAPCFKGILSWSISAGNISADDDLMMVVAGGHWDSTAVVNSITLLPSAGANWLTGCQFMLYGVA